MYSIKDVLGDGYGFYLLRSESARNVVEECLGPTIETWYRRSKNRGMERAIKKRTGF